ncbi:MAG: hypothetical protein Q8933_15800 [Bacteroidota bacterium]|nr:hypothetical protein [Bacteroidota bacterium]MDP4191828.1 hypothetical protein [Bacteroidota bacterium]MDP4195282.1 hypothetical protein [Bacteroidota bacterium]
MDTTLSNRNAPGVISVNDLVMNLEKKKELAQIFIKSGLIPSQLNTPEKVLVCMFKSQELGLPALEGLSGMAVINGKVTLQGNLLLALINRSNKAKKIVIDEQETYCSVTMSRRDYEFEYTFQFSLDDAKKAGLLDKQIWRQYTKTMLKWRAVSGCARVVFSDIIGGLYTPEEIISVSDNVEASVDEDENIQIIEKSKNDMGSSASPEESSSYDFRSSEEESSPSGGVIDDENINHEAIERIKNGSFWNGKVYKNNSVYLDNQKFQLSALELEKFLKVWDELQYARNNDTLSNSDLPF